LHTALSLLQFVAYKIMDVVPQPPYVLDLAPYGLILFLNETATMKALLPGSP